MCKRNGHLIIGLAPSDAWRAEHKTDKTNKKNRTTKNNKPKKTKKSEKNMFLEIHVLQNFAPSCLNRDESNSPKDCEFGGYRRARISSQCIKRNMRVGNFPELLDKAFIGMHTQRLMEILEDKLVTEQKKPAGASADVAKKLVELLDLKLDGKKTKVGLFLSQEEIAGLVKLAVDNFDKIVKDDTGAIKPTAILAGSGDKEPKTKAIDLALFGRMIAEFKGIKNIDAACQVAHAISTNVMAHKFDFFITEDNWEKSEDLGAAMMGTQEYTSACFYRYANVNIDQFCRNLDNNTELLIDGIDAFVKAFIKMIPTGKQNSMAAQNPPSFVMLVLRREKLWSLVNAFAKPIRSEPENIIADSIERLVEYYSWLEKTYDGSDVVFKAIISESEKLAGLASVKKDNEKTMLDAMRAEVKKCLPQKLKPAK